MVVWLEVVVETLEVPSWMKEVVPVSEWMVLEVIEVVRVEVEVVTVEVPAVE